MSDNIDYDELDKAVSEAIKSTSAPTRGPAKPASKADPAKTAGKPRTSSGPIPIPAVQPMAPKPAARRPQFMDFARPTRSGKPVAKSIPVAKAPVKPTTKPAAAKPAAPVAKPATKATQPAQRRVVASAPSAHAVQPMKSAPARTVSPQMAEQLRQQQLLAKKRMLHEQHRRELLLKQQQAARKETPAIAEAPKQPTVAEAAAAAKVALAKEEAEAPNANNYSVGVRSPFLTNAKVEKRPLGTNIPETSVEALKSTKNIYSQKSPIKKKQSKKHTVVETEHKTSGWVWTLIVLFVIAAGGALGWLAYHLVFANQL